MQMILNNIVCIMIWFLSKENVMVVGLTKGEGPWGPFETDNPLVEGAIAGAIIIGAAGLCWRTITGGK